MREADLTRYFEMIPKSVEAFCTRGMCRIASENNL